MSNKNHPSTLDQIYSLSVSVSLFRFSRQEVRKKSGEKDDASVLSYTTSFSSLHQDYRIFSDTHFWSSVARLILSVVLFWDLLYVCHSINPIHSLTLLASCLSRAFLKLMLLLLIPSADSSRIRCSSELPLILSDKKRITCSDVDCGGKRRRLLDPKSGVT